MSEGQSDAGLTVSVSASVLGVLTVGAEKTIAPGRLIAAARYNRALNDIVKVYGELDGVRVEFVHGRHMNDWEIGMFMEMAGPLEAISIVARHVLQSSQGFTTGTPVTDYQLSIDSAQLLPVYGTRPVTRLDRRNHQAIVEFSDVREAAYARIAAEVAVRQNSDQPGRAVHATQTYGLRWEIGVSTWNSGTLPYVQVDAEGWAAGGFSSKVIANAERDVFLSVLREYVVRLRKPPEGYYHAVLADMHQDAISGDYENDLRIRDYLHSDGAFVTPDSSALLNLPLVKAAMDESLLLWNDFKGRGRKRDGSTSNKSFETYLLIREHLLESWDNGRVECVSNPFQMGVEIMRRSELEIFGTQNRERRTMGSMERVWFESLFDATDKKEMGWIKRRKRFQLVETRTEFYAILPVERCVSVWTKRSVHNSLELPWPNRVMSETTLQALSAMCLFSGCIYPDPSGNVAIDTELFRDNIRNAGRGIGYALSRLEDEHRESLLREGAWYRKPLRLSSLRSFVWKEMAWLDSMSKAWVTRETLTLLNRAGVDVFVHASDGCFAASMYHVESKLRCPALVVDAEIPAGGIVLYKNAESSKSISVRCGDELGAEWTFRRVEQLGNKHLVGAPVEGRCSRVGLEHGSAMYQ